MTDDARTPPELVPIDGVDGTDELRAYLTSQGWTEDGTKLRWQGAGKRSVSEARREQRQREVADAAARVRASDDQMEIRRAFRSGEGELVAAAIGNAHVPASLVQEAFTDGHHALVAGSPGFTPDLQQGMLPTLLADGRGKATSPYAGGQDIVRALVGNAQVPLDVRLELVADSFQWVRPHGAVDAAVSSADPTLLAAVTLDLVDRYQALPVHELDPRRHLERLLEQVAANPSAPATAFDAIAELEHVELDEVLCGNPMLPGRLYQRLSPLTEHRYHGHVSLVAIAAVPEQGWRRRDDAARWRRLWWARGGGRDLMAEPEGGIVDLTELPDSDLIVCCGQQERHHVDEAFGPRLWVRVMWPRSPQQLYVRGFGHGVTVAESGPFLRRAGAAVLAAWCDIRREWVARHPEHVLVVAQHREMVAHDRVWDAAREAVAAGMDDRVVARRLGVKVAELRNEMQGAGEDERPASDADPDDRPAAAEVAYDEGLPVPAVRVTLPPEAPDER